MLRNVLSSVVLLAGLHTAVFAQGTERWVGTWATAEVGRPQNPVPPVPGPALPPFMVNTRCGAPPAPAVVPPPGQTFAPQPYLHFTNQTLRQVVRTSIGGTRARVVLTNAYGTGTVTVGAAHIAVRDKDSAIQGSGRPLTFSGRPSITIPANAIAYSDPVDLTVPQLADLAIDLYLPGTTNTPATVTMHGAALQTNYISESGNHAGKATFPIVGTHAELVPALAGRRRGARQRRRRGRLRRLDYRRRALDARHEQPVARSPGESACWRRASRWGS